MFYVDVGSLLQDVDVEMTLTCRLRPTELITDEYGNPKEYDSSIRVDCNVIEARENVFDVKTNSYLVKTVYEIYLRYDKYGDIDFDGAEFVYNNMTLQVVGVPLKHSYASHFVLKATQKKVKDVIKRR